MNSPLIARAQQYFERHLQVPLEALLAPVNAQNPAGYALKGGGAYRTIADARREDDASLPQGPWEHELKRADWALVARTAAEALHKQSKDLQLAVWLLESQVHEAGFAGLAPGLVLIEGLMRRHWPQLHPQEEGGDLTHRANILRTVNRQLLAVLKQVPISAPGHPSDVCLADWELVLRREQLKAAAEEAAAQREAIIAAMEQTDDRFYGHMAQQLRDAAQAVESLNQTADELFGEQAPSFSALAALTGQLLDLAQGELRRRGLPLIAAQVEPIAAGAAAPQSLATAPAMNTEAAEAPRVAASRAQAYAMLEQAAQMLRELEPHSPAPYLVMRAIGWGRLNTSQLYEEVFVRLRGQLNIFELLGLQVPQAPNA